MLISPITAIRADNLDEKVQKLIMVLRQNDIDSKYKLVVKFEEDKHFLEKQLKLWIKTNNFKGVYESLRKYILNEK